MKFTAFGEIMLRLSPPGYNRIMQEPSFSACFGGSEANVALSLSMLGCETAFITKLPQNDVADACIRELASFGVDTASIVRGGRRMGIYFLEKGAGLRAGKVIYDRECSSIAEASAADFDWSGVFKEPGWFHFTGITPALSPSLPGITADALKAAKAAGCIVSCDLNYRSKLWSRERANGVMTALMPFVDVLIANEGSVFDVFGMMAKEKYYENSLLTNDGMAALADELKAKFGFKKVALTARESISASDNIFSAMLSDENGAYFSAPYQVHIVDRVGAGDAFAAGLIFKLMNGVGGSEAVEFAAAAGALKHTVEGDFNRVSVSEIETVSAGHTGGLVQR